MGFERGCCGRLRDEFDERAKQLLPCVPNLIGCALLQLESGFSVLDVHRELHCIKTSARRLVLHRHLERLLHPTHHRLRPDLLSDHLSSTRLAWLAPLPPARAGKAALEDQLVSTDPGVLVVGLVSVFPRLTAEADEHVKGSNLSSVQPRIVGIVLVNRNELSG